MAQNYEGPEGISYSQQVILMGEIFSMELLSRERAKEEEEEEEEEGGGGGGGGGRGRGDDDGDKNERK
ncbi:hypothetical protein M8J76_009257 [Diaphorina citri]|nr:hypothetical protein M8J76_009257 [Diaphorina citri]